MDERVRVQGYRVEPAEIEAVLSGDARVRNAVVVAHEDASGRTRLAGYVVPRAGTEVSAGELRDRLRARLPGYMVPSALVLVDGLPRDAEGRTDRRAVAAAQAFWRGELAGLGAPTSLRLERVDAAPGHARAYAEADEPRTAALETAGWRSGLTLHTLVQGACALLLARYSGERDVLFGTAVFRRPAESPGVEETVGAFMNTVPVRVAVDGQARVTGWLRGIQARQGERLEHGHMPAAMLRAWSDVPQGLPLFEALLAVENGPAADVLQGRTELQVRTRPAREQTHHPFTLSVVHGTRLRLEADYDRQRLTAAAADRLLGHFLNLLTALAESPESTLGSLEMLDAAERARVVSEWNGTTRSYPSATLPALFTAQAARTPDAMAIGAEDGALTYAELDARSNQLARYLSRLGSGWSRASRWRWSARRTFPSRCWG
jgi:hypothetical protein